MKPLLWCKGLFVVVCLLYICDGRHPPALAQAGHDDRPELYGLQISSAVQQSRMDQLDSHLAQTDARLQRQWDAVTANTNAIAGFQGETRGIAAVLGMLQIGSMVFALRKKREEG